MATATMAMAMAGLWSKPDSRGPDAVFHSAQQMASRQEVRAQSGGSADNVTCRLNDQTSNLHSRLPGLSDVPRRRTGRRGSKSWYEKKTDGEFDIVIVPSDGCYMSGSGSGSDDSDWSVGWFEPHPADFTENESEEGFAVLVPSYKFSTNSTGQSEDKDPSTPAWAALLASVSSDTNPESQKQFDLWLASLTS